MNPGSTLRLGAALLSAMGLAGCANWNTAFRTFDADAGQSVSIDAKQRVVFSVKKESSSGEWRAVCAEPIPALTYAFSIGLDPAIAGAGFGSKSCMASVARSALRAAPYFLKPARLAVPRSRRADRRA